MIPGTAHYVPFTVYLKRVLVEQPTVHIYGIVPFLSQCSVNERKRTALPKRITSAHEKE